MKAAWRFFESAIKPVLDDLERVYPGLLSVEREPPDSEMQAVLRDHQDGSGTGIWLGDGWSSAEDAVAEVSEKVQEAALEAVWHLTGVGIWPACPEHPVGRPLAAGLHRGRATWFCPTDGRALAAIGSLGI